MSFVFAMLVGAATGVLTGAGIGGGTLLVLYLTAFNLVQQGQAQGINLLYFLVTAPAALYQHLKNKLVELKGGTVAAVAGSLAALAGALLSQNAGDNLLKKGFGVLFLIIGVKELFFTKKGDNGANEKS